MDWTRSGYTDICGYKTIELSELPAFRWAFGLWRICVIRTGVSLLHWGASGHPSHPPGGRKMYKLVQRLVALRKWQDLELALVVHDDRAECVDHGIVGVEQPPRLLHAD